jgi:uracil-DNA glycosylase family 4
MKQDKIREMYNSCATELREKTNEMQELLLGEGNTDGDIMVIAEFTSAKEESQHKNLLDYERKKIEPLLKAIGYSYEQVYTTHLLKYRPCRTNKDGRLVSRAARKEEYSIFMPYLKKEIALINPKLIITLGNKTLQQVTGDDSLLVKPEEDQLFVMSIQGKSYKVLPLLHPSQKQFNAELEIVILRETERIMQFLNTNKSKEKKINNEEVVEEKVDVLKKRMFQKIQLGKKSEESLGNEKCITMIYGGEGYVDDPVLVALERISHVLTELGVTMHRIDLYKSKASMETILEYMSKSIGVVLAINVEWYGIGYRMQEFLDQCFYRGEKTVFANTPLFGMVISRKAYEFEAYTHLLKSWEYLGGVEGINLLASIESAAALETNFEWLFGIDKKAESFFRLIQQKKGLLPRSGKIEKVFVEIPVADTKDEQQNLSETIGEEKRTADKGIIENYDSYIEKQQEDIHQLGSLFKQKLSAETIKGEKPWPERFKESYINKGNILAKIQIVVEDDPRENTVLELNNQNIRAYYGQIGESNVIIMGRKTNLRRIMDGKLTMQRAFMTGEIKAKGDFTLLYKFEGLFSL